MQSIIAASILSTVLVSAGPLTSRSTCSPTLQGAGVSVLDGSTEWSVPYVAAGVQLHDDLGENPPYARNNWLVSQIGASDPTYVFKPIGNSNLAVGVVNRQLTLMNYDQTSTAQHFFINCNSCAASGTGQLASTCRVQNGGLCVSLDMGSSLIFLTDCAESILQEWNIHASTE